MFTDKYVLLDGKLYQVTFADMRHLGMETSEPRCAGVSVQIEKRWKSCEHWRTVWNMGPKSKRVLKIIAVARSLS